jgi:hypothetical protein
VTKESAQRRHEEGGRSLSTRLGDSHMLKQVTLATMLATSAMAAPGNAGSVIDPGQCEKATRRGDGK